MVDFLWSAFETTQKWGTPPPSPFHGNRHVRVLILPSHCSTLSRIPGTKRDLTWDLLVLREALVGVSYGKSQGSQTF